MNKHKEKEKNQGIKTFLFNHSSQYLLVLQLLHNQIQMKDLQNPILHCILLVLLQMHCRLLLVKQQGFFLKMPAVHS
jgi:hypothetical protein